MIVRQVPTYAIIGNGRVAKHICHYFNELALDYQCWSRANHSIEKLHSMLSHSTHVLILISDTAIDHFVSSTILPQHPHLLNIHFSGCLVSQYAYSAHPLQTFTGQLYSLNDYKKIPFILGEDSPPFAQLLPGLENPNYTIKKSEKAYYHALCVMANNFSTLLWQKFYAEMKNRFQVKPEDLSPILHQTFHNIEANPEASLTGPIQRKDKTTLDNDLNALMGDEFFEIFKAFVDQFVDVAGLK